MSAFHFYSPPSKEKGRVTISAILEGKQMSFGIAKCSLKDQFSRKKGRTISTGRAVANPCYITLIPKEVQTSGLYGRFFVEEAKKLLETCETGQIKEHAKEKEFSITSWIKRLFF